jgi:hypothetical protein
MMPRKLFLCASGLLLLSAGGLFAQLPPQPSEVAELDKAVAIPTATSYFIGTTPCRIADTRGGGFGGAYGPPALALGTPRDFILTGRCGIPDTARAVSLNVTVIQPTGAGYLSIFPLGGAVPPVSTLNFTEGQVVANAALVALGEGGGITVFTGGAGAHLVIDVNGYFVGAQKLCTAINRTKDWRETIIVPPNWTADQCNAFKLLTISTIDERAYQLGCLSTTEVSIGALNGGLPSPNCGW